MQFNNKPQFEDFIQSVILNLEPDFKSRRKNMV